MLLALRFVLVSLGSRPGFTYGTSDRFQRSEPQTPTWEATAQVLTSRPTIRPNSSVAVRGISGWVPVLVSTSLLAGCGHASKRTQVATPASHAEADERPFTIQPPVDLDVEHPNNAVVRVVSDVTCTGTLIAEDLVLTAHHCVAERDADGQVLNRDKPAEKFMVELGGDDLPWGEVQVKAVVSPDCGYISGNGDLAILVLSRKLVGVPTMVPRLDAPPISSEQVVPIGFGRCALSKSAIHRVERTGGKIARIEDGKFIAVASVCPGDSGGPVVSPGRSDVVGVVSASVMDGDEQTAGPSVFVRLDVWPELFSAALEIAAGASPNELPPFRSCQR
jgi:hypothetical protein